MRRFIPPLSVLLLALLLPVVGTFQTATAQESSFDVETPITSLTEAQLDSDQQRAKFATALMQAREDTEISYETYQAGVRFFRQNHPEFYGNFFGDPFYATYDVHYQNTAWDFVTAHDLHNTNGSNVNGSFFCNPLSYDPAFGCYGFTFAASDFFFVPSFFVASSGQVPLSFPTRADRPRSLGTPDILHTARAAEGSRVVPEKTRQGPDLEHIVGRLQLPDNVYRSIQEKASNLEQIERVLRFRQRIERRYGHRDLSPRERAKLAMRFAEMGDSETFGPGDRADAFSRAHWNVRGDELGIPKGRRGHMEISPSEIDARRVGPAPQNADTPETESPNAGPSTRSESDAHRERESEGP